MTGVVVVGAGDVFRRYMAVPRSLANEARFWISDVIDTRPGEELRGSAVALGAAKNTKFHQLTDTSPNGLMRLMHNVAQPATPVVIATPVKFHVPYAVALLDKGMHVAIEKPYAYCRDHIEKFDGAVRAHGLRRVFLFGYYALEKGLPLLVLARAGRVDPVYLGLLQPAVSEPECAAIRASLGRLRRVSGCILEGKGPAAQLRQRTWILYPEFGGLTVEMFYHLSCMLLPWVDSEEIRIRNISLQTHRATAVSFRARTGVEAAETLTAAHLTIGEDIEAYLIAAKYVPESLHQRWFELEFQRGRVFADLEQMSLRVETGEHCLETAIRLRTPYAAQFRIFLEKLGRASVPTEYALFKDALTLTLKIRDAGLTRGISHYETEDISEAAVAAFFQGDDRWRAICEPERARRS